MIISFEGPMFFTPADEDQFFLWLKSLPDYQDLRGVGTVLHLTLSDPVQPATVGELLVIFRRWCVGIEPLSPLRSSETRGLALWDTGLGVASAAGA